MVGYKEMMKKRYKDRKNNILTNLPKMTEEQLRWTVRTFKDCMKPKAIEKYLNDYNEFFSIKELRDFVENFVSVYTRLAIRELKDKEGKADDYFLKNLTNEDLQSMSAVEKWEKIRSEGLTIKDYQLIREIARIGVCLKLDLLFDTGLAESVIEFPLYFELQEKLNKLKKAELLNLTNRILISLKGIDEIKSEEDMANKLKQLHTIIKEAVGIKEPFEEIIGIQMERIPRGGYEPPEVAALRYALTKMEIKDLRMSAIVNLDLLTMSEFKEIAEPFIKKHPSFFEMPSETLIDFIVEVSKKIGDRALSDYIERFRKGRLLFAEKVDEDEWNLLSFQEKLSHISEDNNFMDNAVIARHFARFLLADDYNSLFNVKKQIDLILNKDYMDIQAKFIRQYSSEEEIRIIKYLMNTVSYKVLEMEGVEAGLRDGKLKEIKTLIGEKAGVTSSVLTPFSGRTQ